MLDRLTGFFRRGTSAPATPAHAAQPASRTPADRRASADRETDTRASEAARLLDSTLAQADLLRIVRDDLPADLRLRAIARLDDAAALREIALHDKVARVRLQAAERLSAPADLEILRRDSSDKAVQRHARETLKTLRETERQVEETRARIGHLLTSVAQHASRAFEPLYDAKLDSLETAWQAVAAQASATEQERFAELAALARETVRRHAAEIAARQQAIAAKQELIAACHELESVVQRLRREDLAGDVAAVTALRVTQETRWQEAAALTAVDAPLEQRFLAARDTLDAWLNAAAELPRAAQEASQLLAAVAAAAEEVDDNLLDDWLHALDGLLARCAWPDGLAQPALLTELVEARRRVRQMEKARQLDLQQQIVQLRRRRHALKRMIEEGQLRTATRTLAWLKKRITALPAADAGRELAALEPVTEDLQRLHDWYAFASAPKKAEMCERAEALAGETLVTDPARHAEQAEAIAERAEQVRALREHWNLLCAADPDADPELRARFDAAIAIAYAPCGEWYAELHRRQDDNLAARAALCDELTAFIAAIPASGPDWRAIEQHERDARARWKTLEPVRWPDARSSQERFSALIGDLRARLEEERRRNAARRDELIEQAAALLALEPLDAAIQSAKRLQESWKSVGYTDPRDDRRQWQTFRAALDAVFARRDAARHAEHEAREAARREAEQRQQEAERQQQEARARRAEQQNRLREARRQEIETALALADAEAGWLAGEAVDTEVLAPRISSLTKSPLAVALTARWERLCRHERPDEASLAAQADALALLTLDLEIAHDLPSPPAQAELRMQRKIERLNAALRGGQREREGGDPRTALLDQWLATGPVAGEARQAARERLSAVLSRI